MNERCTIETAEPIDDPALPATEAVHSLRTGFAIAALSGGALVTILWMGILVYALIVFLF